MYKYGELWSSNARDWGVRNLYFWNDTAKCGCLSHWISQQLLTDRYQHFSFGKPPHRAETLSSPELSTSGVHGVTEWCVLTSWPQIPAMRQHSIQTATIFGGHQTHWLKLNCSSRPYWPPVPEWGSVRHDVVSIAAHYGSVEVPRNLLWRQKRRACSWFVFCLWYKIGCHGNVPWRIQKNWTGSRKFTQMPFIWWKDRENGSSRYWDSFAHIKK